MTEPHEKYASYAKILSLYVSYNLRLITKKEKKKFQRFEIFVKYNLILTLNKFWQILISSNSSNSSNRNQDLASRKIQFPRSKSIRGRDSSKL